MLSGYLKRQVWLKFQGRIVCVCVSVCVQESSTHASTSIKLRGSLKVPLSQLYSHHIHVPIPY